jgi:hypothetical protein
MEALHLSLPTCSPKHLRNCAKASLDESRIEELQTRKAAAAAGLD